MSKISVVGAGGVGAATALGLVAGGHPEVVLIDRTESKVQGLAEDLRDAVGVAGGRTAVVGTTDRSAIADSTVVVITAGKSRDTLTGSRDDLLKINAPTIHAIAKDVHRFAPDAVVVVVTNPVEAMCAAVEAAGVPRSRIVGMAGVLDSGRFRRHLAAAQKVAPSRVQAEVLGRHAAEMVPVVSLATIDDMPVEKVLTRAQIDDAITSTRWAGPRVIGLNGGTKYGPAAAIVQMVDAIAWDQQRVLPCVAYCDGQFELRGVHVGVPVRLGSGGVEAIVERPLSRVEHDALQAAATSVRQLVSRLDRVLAEG